MKGRTVRVLDECLVLAILSFGCWILYFTVAGFLAEATDRLQIALVRIAGLHVAYFGPVVVPASVLTASVAGLSLGYLLKRRHLVYAVLIATPIAVFSIVFGPPRFRVVFALLTLVVVIGPMAVAARFFGRALRSRASPFGSQNVAPGGEQRAYPVPGAIVIVSDLLILTSVAAIYPALAKFGASFAGAIGGLSASALSLAVAYELRAMRKWAAVVFAAVVVGLYAAGAVILEHFPWEPFITSAPLFLAVMAVSVWYWPRMR